MCLEKQEVLDAGPKWYWFTENWCKCSLSIWVSEFLNTVLEGLCKGKKWITFGVSASQSPLHPRVYYKQIAFFGGRFCFTGISARQICFVHVRRNLTLCSLKNTCSSICSDSEIKCWLFFFPFLAMFFFDLVTTRFPNGAEFFHCICMNPTTHPLPAWDHCTVSTHKQTPCFYCIRPIKRFSASKGPGGSRQIFAFD